MTYCIAMNLEEGMFFASDTRTNAGVDHVATFPKMTVFQTPNDRVMVLLTSGNLATSQSVVSMLRHHAAHDPEGRNIYTVKSMYEAAVLIGEAMRDVIHRDGPTLSASNIESGASFLLGGQIRGEAPRLFNVYPQGNFIESTPDTPYFQIGESKYGKPIIDRIITWQTPVLEAARCALISFDSTIKSNLSVGLPIDLLCYERDCYNVGIQKRITESDPYFKEIRQRWGDGLRGAFANLPPLDWK